MQIAGPALSCPATANAQFLWADKRLARKTWNTIVSARVRGSALLRTRLICHYTHRSVRQLSPPPQP